MTLKQKTFSAVRWTTFAMLTKAVLMLLQMAILARLLAPSDFGLMALVAAVIAFAQIFSDMGISNSIIHHQEISQESLSGLYWINVLASAALMTFLMLLSPFIAEWYHEPRMQTILMWVSTSFLIAALGQQLRVMAEKNLHFQKLAIIELAASLIGFLVSVLVALSGGGIFALVAGMLTGVLFSTVLYWWVLADGWRPMWRLRVAEIREFLGFGAYMLGFSLCNTINMQADILIGGRSLGTESLGTFSLPKEISLRLAMIINPIITRVGLPVMAQVQDDKRRLKDIYLKTLLMTSSVNFPLYMMIAAFAPEIVEIMLGSQWHESIPLLQIFSLWGLVRSTGNPVGSLILAIGRAKWMFWWSLGQLAFQLPMIWWGSKFGAHGLAISLLIAVLISSVAIWFFLVRPACGATFTEFTKLFIAPIYISIISVFVGVLTSYPFEGAFIRLGIGSVMGGFIYVVISRRLNRSWFEAVTVLLLGKQRSSRLIEK